MTFDDDKPINENDSSSEELTSRRDFLVSTKKWSKAVIAGVLAGAAVSVASRNVAEAGGWVNRRGGGGGGWVNGGGGGGWINGGGGGWINGGGGGGWINRR